MKSKIFVILGLIIALTACGQSGKLYLPKDEKIELKAKEAEQLAKQKAMLQEQDQQQVQQQSQSALVTS